jgi:large subunit ribosomal protein L24e
MVLKTEVCRFSGSKIYPGRGIRFIRSDSQVFLFLNSKCKRYFHNRLKPAKLSWTALFRKQHKKDMHDTAVKKKRRASNKPYSRSIVGASLEVIQKKRIKKTKDEKKAKQAESVKTTKGPGKQATRAPQPKAAKTSAGGKR